MSGLLRQARSSGDLDDLATAFQEWAENHGIVWFGNDIALAEAIADVLGQEFAFESSDEGAW